MASWKAHHKYVCTGSKNRLDVGAQVTIQGLENKPQHNGKNAIVVNFISASRRFAVQICAEDDENGEKIPLSVKPQNLSKVQ
jgi:hypothetical protein